MTEDGPYKTIPDDAGCDTCSAGKSFSVIGTDGVMLGTPWAEREDVEEVCELLNEAYSQGQLSIINNTEPMKSVRADNAKALLEGEEMKDFGCGYVEGGIIALCLAVLWLAWRLI